MKQPKTHDAAMNIKKLMLLLFAILPFVGVSAQLDLDDIPGFASAAENEEEPIGQERIRQEIEKLEANMDEARKAIALAAQDETKTIKALDDMAARLRANIAILSPDGEMGKEVKALIQKTQEEARSLRGEGNNAENDPEIRNTYLETADDIDDEVAQLFNTSEVLRSGTRELEKQLKKVEQHKKLYVALLRVGNLKRATQAYAQVQKQVDAIVYTLDTLGKKIVIDEAGKPDPK